MCQFNLLVINKTTNKEILKDIVISNNFGYQEIEIKSLTHQIQQNQTILLTKRNCDCGSIVGLNNRNRLTNINIEKEQKKLKKKRWSKTKIDRYLSEKIKAQNKRNETKNVEVNIKEAQWISLSETLIDNNIPFAILFTQFSGQIEEEDLTISIANKHPIDSIRKGAIRNFQEKELNWILK